MENEQFIIGAIMAKDPGQLSQEEQTTLAEWLKKDGNQDIYNKATSEENKEQGIKRLYELVRENDRCLEKFYGVAGIIPIAAPEKKLINLWRKWPRNMVAASVTVAVLVSGYLWYANRSHSPVADHTTVQAPVTIKTDADPGRFKAKLVLADGSSIVLDSAARGKLAQQGTTTVVNEDGKLVYKSAAGEEHKEAVIYNKLVTSKGETFSTVLSDGSKIWLNSESSISYPVTFTGDERKVTITGEAYFEVATAYVKGSKSVKQPFKVAVGNMEIEVLGTHFNVNAYADEDAIKTTLLEGKVKVTSGTMSSVLAPGQQALLKKGATLLAVKDGADLEEAVAWKNGFFQFSDDDLKTVMRQLARWYDVEVIYQGGINSDTYGGRINRNSKASEVLTLLGRNRVKYKIEGKKIIITP